MRQGCAVAAPWLLLPVVCGLVADVTTNMFIHYSDYMTWSAAQTYCRAYHTDLVTIASETGNQKYFSTRGWVGLYQDDLNGPWKWSRGGQIANFTRWGTGEPIANYNCAFKMSNSLTWVTDKCDRVHTFNCYDETLLVTESKTWEEALSYCRSLEAVDPSQPATLLNNSCFDLATVVTQDDYSSLGQKILDAATDEVWIGLRYLAGQWVWAGGEKAQYEDTGSCPAEGFCGILVKDGTTTVKTRDCQLEMNFVCYRKP